MSYNDNAVDFAFIDAQNIYEAARSLGRTNGLNELDLSEINFEYVVGNGASPKWPIHARRFVYYAGINGSSPDWLLSAEKATGFVLRNGQLAHRKGGSGAKQQGVDVLLAVEAMQHSFRRSMTHCTIYSADGDFLPLIDEIVSNGTLVRVKSFSDPEQGVVTPSLRRSADLYERMSFIDVYRALPDRLKVRNVHSVHKYSIDLSIYESQQHDGVDTYVRKSGDGGDILIPESEHYFRQLSFRDSLALELYSRIGAVSLPWSEQTKYFGDLVYQSRYDL